MNDMESYISADVDDLKSEWREFKSEFKKDAIRDVNQIEKTINDSSKEIIMLMDQHAAGLLSQLVSEENAVKESIPSSPHDDQMESDPNEEGLT